MSASKPSVIHLGPCLTAVSGISTHIAELMGSALARDFALVHFQVGSEGHAETTLARLWRLTTSPLALAARILRSDAEIVHINTAMNHRAFWRDLAYLLLAKACGSRVIWQIHGGELPREFIASERVPAKLLHAALTLPDVLVVINRPQLTAYREFVPEQRIVSLPNGIDVEPYRNAERAPADPAAPLRLLFLGRMAPEKGIDETLHGLAMARAQGVAATLVLAGAGPEEMRYRTLASELDLDDIVRFIEPVHNSAKRQLLDASDILLLPSYTEGLPYALLECMAAGVPAIATRVGGVPEVVEDRVHGLLVPVGDAEAICRALVELSHDRDLVPAMARACRQRVAHSYAIGRVADDFARLYRGICGAGRTPQTP